MKLTTRCGSAAVEGLNEALLAKAVEVKVLRTSKIRVDTTVVPANVAYPTDSALLAKAINRRATGRRIRAAGGAVRTKLRDRSRAAGQRAHDLNAKLRTRNAAAKEEALAVVRRKNAELPVWLRPRRRMPTASSPTRNAPSPKRRPTRPTQGRGSIRRGRRPAL
jgi:IS5 family transposase